MRDFCENVFCFEYREKKKRKIRKIKTRKHLLPHSMYSLIYFYNKDPWLSSFKFIWKCFILLPLLMVKPSEKESSNGAN